jgi:cell division topological specificity factor
MSILDYLLRKRKKTANVAKERLQIILANQNPGNQGPEFLPELKRELLQVISKYVDIDLDAIQVNLERDSDCEILELNIPLDGQVKQQKVAS